MSDSPNEGLEHAEHAEHAAHSGNPLLATVSATIAVLAVIAATLGSAETYESGTAISDKNGSVLLQDQATDAWTLYQAQSIKRNMYEIAAAATPDHGDDYRKKASGYAGDQEGSRKQAEDLEHRRDEILEASEGHERRHRIITVGLTLVHVSIAVATISIITGGRRWPWYTAMLMGAVGTAIGCYSYLT